MDMEQSELFADYEIKEGEKLYVIGNGFDVHHWIDSKYTDFKEWVRKNKDADLIGLMDTYSAMSVTSGLTLKMRWVIIGKMK